MGEREIVNEEANTHNFKKQWAVWSQKTNHVPEDGALGRTGGGGWRGCGAAAVIPWLQSWAKWWEGTSHVRK